MGFVYWWERQLPGKIARAAATGQLDDCLRYSDQLSALSWLPGRMPIEQGQCRREKARLLWRSGQWRQALALQRQLLGSPAASRSDQQQLDGWQEELHRSALERFRSGDLKGALESLAPLGEERRPDGNALGDQLRQNWTRNRLAWERASALVGKARWWEALDSLNRLDHPWWIRKGEGVRRQIAVGLAKLQEREREHDSHGDLPHTVPTTSLDAEVSRRIATGMNEWQAFQSACGALGGKVVEAGPDAACQR